MTDELIDSHTWNCPVCLAELGEYNGWCEYCKVDDVIVYNPDKYFIREICIYHISKGDKPVTPQEELFAELFNHEKVLVKDMDVLTLRAHREELSKIAFEARARLTAVDDEEKDRKNKNSAAKQQGFSRSVNTDETTTNAINAIKDRQKRMSKQDKIQASLEKLGISSTDAAKLMSAGAILGRLKNKIEEKPSESVAPTESKPLFNPFAK